MIIQRPQNMLFDYKSRALNSIKDHLVSFIPQISHGAQRHSSPHLSCTMAMKMSLPHFKKHIHKFGHHTHQPKQCEDKRPNICCQRTMKQQVINRFPTAFTHTRPINYQQILFVKDSIVKIFPRVTVHKKNTNF